jgi:hypothetical protein
VTAPAQEKARGTTNRWTEAKGTLNAGNPGKYLGNQTVNGVDYARYRAEPSTWISASLKQQGYDRWYGRNTAFGAYERIVRTPDDQPFVAPDKIKPGQEYLVPIAKETPADRSPQSQVVLNTQGVEEKSIPPVSTIGGISVGSRSEAKPPYSPPPLIQAIPPLTRSGTKLETNPSVTRLREPVDDPNYVDNIVSAVSISGSDYVLHWSAEGREYTSPLPDSWINRNNDVPTVIIFGKVFRTRQEAIAGLVPVILDPRAAGAMHYVGLWGNETEPFTVPTLFSNVSTPRIMAGIEQKDEDMRRAARDAVEELERLRAGLVMGKVLGETYKLLQNPNLYRAASALLRRFASKPVTLPVRTTTTTEASRLNASNATKPPASGAQSKARPATSGATSSTTASPIQRATTPQNRATGADSRTNLASEPPNARGATNAPTTSRVAPTLLQRQRAFALSQVAAQKDAQAAVFEQRAAAVREPNKAVEFRKSAAVLRSDAALLRKEGQEYANGVRSATTDFPQPEDIDRAIGKLEAGDGDFQPLVQVPLAASERLPQDLPRLTRLLVKGGRGRLVLRVEGDGSRSLVTIQPGGDVSLTSRTAYFNFGSVDRALEFLAKRGPGARIVTFEVDEAWVQSLRSWAIPQRGTGFLSGQPRLVDVRFADDQLEIPPALIPEMEHFIVPGSGRILETTGTPPNP